MHGDEQELISCASGGIIETDMAISSWALGLALMQAAGDEASGLY